MLRLVGALVAPLVVVVLQLRIAAAGASAAVNLLVDSLDACVQAVGGRCQLVVGQGAVLHLLLGRGYGLVKDAPRRGFAGHVLPPRQHLVGIGDALLQRCVARHRLLGRRHGCRQRGVRFLQCVLVVDGFVVFAGACAGQCLACFVDGLVETVCCRLLHHVGSIILSLRHEALQFLDDVRRADLADVLQLEVVHAEIVPRGVLGLHADFNLPLFLHDGEVDMVGFHGCDERLREPGIEVCTLLCGACIGDTALSRLLDVQGVGQEAVVALGQPFQHLREAGVRNFVSPADPCLHIVGAVLLGEIAVGL